MKKNSFQNNFNSINSPVSVSFHLKNILMQGIVNLDIVFCSQEVASLYIKLFQKWRQILSIKSRPKLGKAIFPCSSYIIWRCIYIPLTF